jgi:ABC-2 type transport system ATP-binding protein
MTEAALVMENVSKRYGSTVALDGLSFFIPRGVICGFVGPNGAGKTTTIGIVGGLIRAQRGKVDILGRGAFDPRVHAGRVTLLPQDCRLNPQVRVVDLLTYYARLQGATAVEARRDAERVLAEVMLQDRAGSKINQLSHGMRRRVAVAQALLGDPQLILMDEPTSGLDPELVARMRDIFLAHRGTTTLVISSHILAELETICDYVVFIERGRCIRSGSLADVTRRGVLLRYTLEKPIDTSELEQGLANHRFTWRGNVLEVVGPSDSSVPEVNAAIVPWLLAHGGSLFEIDHGQSLEDAYLEDKKLPSR